MDNDFVKAHKLAYTTINNVKSYYLHKGLYLASREQFLLENKNLDLHKLDGNDKLLKEMLNDYMSYKLITIALLNNYDELISLSKNGLAVYLNVCKKHDPYFEQPNAKPIEIIGEILMYNYLGSGSEKEIDEYLYKLSELNTKEKNSCNPKDLDNPLEFNKKISKLEQKYEVSLQLYDKEHFQSIKRLTVFFNKYSRTDSLDKFKEFIGLNTSKHRGYEDYNDLFVNVRELNSLLNETNVCTL